MSQNESTRSIRNLVVVLGDQLDQESAALRDFQLEDDCVWMAEVKGESEYVASSKQRTVLFLSAMRHFRQWLKSKDFDVVYTELDDENNKGQLDAQLIDFLKTHDVEFVTMLEPGEYRLKQVFEKACSSCDVKLRMLADAHFLSSQDDFSKHVQGRKQLRMEYFYREMRKRYGVLMDGDKPAEGKWNFDSSNRGSFGKGGPKNLPERISFPPDPITGGVIALVEETFADNPGRVSSFPWPVTREDALKALDDFIDTCLPHFGKYQDAMWTEEPFLYHSLIASSLNLKLLNPREVIDAAENAYKNGDAPIEAVEGFIRQILGWREYVRGIYWRFMPDYIERNALKAGRDLPDFYWTGDTEMKCMQSCITQTLEHGYAHHIQRLMVTGLFSLVYGVDPKQVHEWYLGVYVDAVEWVELPNTLGMSQYGDGGVMASKPYVATGKYIQRMSNYCQGCRYDPAESVGDKACPFTTLYWDFLMRHQKTLESNNRMSMQLRNLARFDEEKRNKIRERAEWLCENKI